jgi:hypothetical protein
MGLGVTKIGSKACQVIVEAAPPTAQWTDHTRDPSRRVEITNRKRGQDHARVAGAANHQRRPSVASTTWIVFDFLV